MPLIAIATSDGVTIDGRIDSQGVFIIYRFNNQGCWEEVGQRSTPRSPGCRHLPMVPQAAALLLADVDVILVTHVSKMTTAFLRNRGILAFAVQGTVEHALASYSRRGNLLDTLLAHTRRSAGRPARPTSPNETR
jgi:predicted Fe-Mo cluster-binding NifX family protein